jgi:HSP20 family protein
MMNVLSQPGFDQRNKRFPYHVNKDENGYTLQMALPGYSKERIEIGFEAGRLTIKAEDEKEATVFARSGFERRFIMPEHVDTDAIEAKFSDGVLSITIPFKPTFRREVKIS